MDVSNDENALNLPIRKNMQINPNVCLSEVKLTPPVLDNSKEGKHVCKSVLQPKESLVVEKLTGDFRNVACKKKEGGV